MIAALHQPSVFIGVLLVVLVRSETSKPLQWWWPAENDKQNDDIIQNEFPWGEKLFKSSNNNQRYLDITYGSPSYPDCVCGLAKLTQARVPRQQDGDEDGERVVGGEEAIPHSLPWMALVIDESRGNEPICGGSVISDRYVLSAAHCFDDSTPQEQLKVVLGEHDRCRADRQTTRFSIERLVLHPGYVHENYYADLALLRLSMRITFSRTVRPICLPSPVSNFEGSWALVSGWGSANYSGPVQCKLQQAQLPVLRRDVCIQESKHPPERIHETILCAGLLDAGAKDSCQGDSGGPLQLLHPRTHRFTLIGIVSNGVGCGLADYPGLYTSVSHHVPWILAATRDSAYCFR